MSKVKFELNRAGVRELLKGAKMQAIIQRATDQVLRAAQETGLEYASDVSQKRYRVAGTVTAESAHAGNDNKENNTMEKALRRGTV